jgi:hypothetical protein
VDYDPAHVGEVYFTAYWVAAMISLTVVGVFALPLLIVAVVLGSPWGVVLVVPVVLASAALIVRSLRISLTVGPDYVVVQNFGRSYRLPWASMHAVVLTRGSFIDDGELIEFRLRSDGSTLAQASLGRARRRKRMLAAIRPYAERWRISVPASD